MSAVLYRHLQDVGRGLLDLLFPATCLYCRGAADAAEIAALCRDCYSDLQPAAGRFAEMHILNRLEDPYLDRLLVVFHFNDVVRSLIHAIKYHHMPKLAVAVGGIAISKAAWTLEESALLVPVPLHTQRRRERGYNQSERIAMGIAAHNKLLVRSDLLQRVRYTHSQTRLNRKERQSNLAEAFALSPKAKLHIKGRDIILVDDVMTTGTTLNECAALLKGAGAATVSGIALAAPIREGQGIYVPEEEFLLF